MLASVVVAALSWPTGVAAYTFGDWVRDHAYSPGAVMPESVDAKYSSPAIQTLDGIGVFDWTTTPTTSLQLRGNELSSIETGDFSGLESLNSLGLAFNELNQHRAG